MSHLMILESDTELIRSESSELIGFVSPQALISGELPEWNFFLINILRELAWDHIEQHTDNCFQDITLLIFRKDIMILLQQASELNLYE